MTTQNYTVTMLVASDGYKLTQADDNIGIEKRIIATRVALAINDSIENWKEIPDAEAEVIEANIKATLKSAFGNS